MQVLSKGDFAAHIGVSAGRVSQYIAAGMIGQDALEGQGRNAKVIVARAVEQIKRKRDIGQSLGNGLSTRLDLEPDDQPEPARSAAGSDTTLRTPNVDDELKQQRLEAERRRNRLAAEDEAARRGRLVDASHVRAEMTKLAQAIEDENAGMLTDFASAVAAEFKLPQRDVLHLLRKVRADKKAGAADRARRRAASLPEFVEAIIEESAA
ncbi:hypothetical protein [Mesorhizobium sp. M7A.F.Ce.TU.012.03.2.1]|uniref:hypothetical protein n=1 Tax=Mesorhizobium sp. M7A.F.Ce.TU.012.03.2.1 TaxID=2493681 RepID=UPI000FD8E0EF|nr:hypothetical protein [Mesorhizobium sp. M7A.F.Ce.TU.012.03.2.1]AZV21457.1 hypothetical protein EJ079_21680 [Mesorhizobium sp. M7A.F.Ce.TU.012.03.2.1]